jgi:microcystin-dependent protein
MSSPYLSQILMFSGNYAPRNYALCNGQLLSISQQQALFSLLGTNYGGNGTTTFALPNLQSRLPVSYGQGPGLSNYVIGQAAGTPSETLNQSTVPSHGHFFQASTSATNTTSSSIANNLVPGTPSAANGEFYAHPPGGGQPALIPHLMAAGVCSTQGQSLPHSNLMPSLCITFAIALSGAFPSRN